MERKDREGWIGKKNREMSRQNPSAKAKERSILWGSAVIIGIAEQYAEEGYEEGIKKNDVRHPTGDTAGKS